MTALERERKAVKETVVFLAEQLSDEELEQVQSELDGVIVGRYLGKLSKIRSELSNKRKMVLREIDGERT